MAVALFSEVVKTSITFPSAVHAVGSNVITSDCCGILKIVSLDEEEIWQLETDCWNQNQRYLLPFAYIGFYIFF